MGGVSGTVRVTRTPVTRLGLIEAAALFDLATPALDLSEASPKLGEHAAYTQGHTFSSPDSLDRTRMLGFLVRSVRPAAGQIALMQNLQPTRTLAGISRRLHETDDALVSGVWRVETPQHQCGFDPQSTANASMIVPVEQGSGVRPDSVNLRPSQEWTLEAWFKPGSSQLSRLITFQDGRSPVPPGAPELAYAVDLDGQEVIGFANYRKTPGQKDASFFQTGTSAKASLMPSGAMTWEMWLKPDADAGPPSGQGTAPLGGLIQLGQEGRDPFLSLGLTRDRHVVLKTLDPQSKSSRRTSEGVVPPAPAWTHLALTGTEDISASPPTWSFTLLIDGRTALEWDGVSLQSQPSAYLVIGANTPQNASLFGRMAQLRYWSIARSKADIRRTWLTSLTGNEPGLVGAWPLTAIETGANNKRFVRNISRVAGSDLDAQLFQFPQQGVNEVKDSFFLSVIAAVGGLPAVKADALLANERWNHLAVVFRAGGAVDLNPPERFEAGRYDWLVTQDSESLGPLDQFAMDGWVRIESGIMGEIGTIAARWSSDENPSEQAYRFWVDRDGALNFSIALNNDRSGGFDLYSATSTGIDLRDAHTHHVAVVFTSSDADTETKTKAAWKISFFVDGKATGDGSGTLDDVRTVRVRVSQNPVTFGTAYPPVPSAQPLPVEDFGLFRGRLGALRFWTTAARVEELFPERFPRHPLAGRARNASALWSFREQAGRVAHDSIGGIDAKLTSSAAWASLADTSELAFVANGADVGTMTPFTASTGTTPTSQFALGTPAGFTGGTGFAGNVAQVSLWDEARTTETIQDQQFIPRTGNEVGLVAAWTFSQGGLDVTGGGNDADPPLAPSRITLSDAPLSIEGPYVRNVYGGRTTDRTVSAPGTIAVSQYTDAQGVGTDRQRATLKRQFVFDPSQTFVRPVQIGELALTYIGQIQTDPTLIGFIEGAPPVPSENLTRPYYLSPGSPGYMRYLDTSTVTLSQAATTNMSFSSSSSRLTQIDVAGALGIFGVRGRTGLSKGSPVFLINTDTYDLKTVGQAVLSGSFEIGSGSSEQVAGEWTGTQSDLMGFSGDWEPFQRDPSRYFNPTVGRRFVPDNLGYALVESLTADLYAVTFRETGAALSTIAIPNPAIPPDRNVLLFPIDPQYVKAGTLDGRIGLLNDPDYPNADIKRGSYFKPVEAFALAATIENEHARAESRAAQFDPAQRVLGRDLDLQPARAILPFDFEEAPRDPVGVASPAQGIVNRHLWTADGGLHMEGQQLGATVSKSYTGGVVTGGGGGFHLEGEFFAKLGFAWSFDAMVTHKLDVHLGRDQTQQQVLGLDVNVEGEAFLRAFDPDAPAEYGSGQGAFVPGAAPGKVRGYRFMTFYAPPSLENGQHFRQIIDPLWLRFSNAPMARALREIGNLGSVWRVLHRVTFVERVPPPVASRPVTAPETLVREPNNLPGNVNFLRLVDAALPKDVSSRSRLVIGNAVAQVMNPAPTQPGVYPASALEGILSWWRPFLDRARPNADGHLEDPGAAALLLALTSRATAYCFDAYASGAITDVLGPRTRVLRRPRHRPQPTPVRHAAPPLPPEAVTA